MNVYNCVWQIGLNETGKDEEDTGANNNNGNNDKNLSLDLTIGLYNQS